MLRSMYSGVSGMKAFQTKLDVIGNNIANVNTVGFKSSRIMFSDILSQTVSGATTPEADEQGGVNPKQVGLGVAAASISTVHTQGSAMTTNDGKDLRIDGDGFFVVQANGDSEMLLTRAGNFTLDANRQLVTADGYYVLSTDGTPITLDEDVTSFSISQDGNVMATTADGTESVGQIAIARVTNPSGLEKVGGSKYRLTGNADLADSVEDLIDAPGVDGRGSIIAGQLEMSNVDLTDEFTEMIVAQRGFQANSRIITTSDSILEEVVNLKR
ncbi:flagellar basal body rod protein FlgG [Paenibacillus protaetiae]|uniref:Flagellar hook protein FlgE n=1 Tax=Paenibacillus protaetiae TaxID=2509456 RepID=A0A4P6ESP8_9BACL|nr:flagellar basal body rod protein FlgG [Paenibacillus protaetiae]QAY65606.1 flagellar hook-basal body complex protein [Paenibacillus protaetiae]